MRSHTCTTNAQREIVKLFLFGGGVFLCCFSKKRREEERGSEKKEEDHGDRIKDSKICKRLLARLGALCAR